MKYCCTRRKHKFLRGGAVSGVIKSTTIMQRENTVSNYQCTTEPLLWFCKSLTFTVCQHEDISKILIGAHVFCWQGDFLSTRSNIRKTNGVIWNSHLAFMIKHDSYLYFLAIHFPVSLASQPTHDS